MIVWMIYYTKVYLIFFYSFLIDSMEGREYSTRHTANGQRAAVMNWLLIKRIMTQNSSNYCYHYYYTICYYIGIVTLVSFNFYYSLNNVLQYALLTLSYLFS